MKNGWDTSDSLRDLKKAIGTTLGYILLIFQKS